MSSIFENRARARDVTVYRNRKRAQDDRSFLDAVDRGNSGQGAMTLIVIPFLTCISKICTPLLAVTVTKFFFLLSNKGNI